MRRVILKAAVVVLLVAALLAAGGLHYLRRSLPQIDGTAPVAGLTAPIDIIRDADAIPHVFAATKADALFGLGYVHAQDRLWQMELQRRIGHGRLSEVLGEATIPQDRFLRTVGFGRAAKSAWASTPEWAKQQIDAYVAGVNAFISTHHGAKLPPEFSLLRFEPEPWSGVDVIVWVKMMAWDLSANYAFELLRHDMAQAVGVERMKQLMPAYPLAGLSILPDRPGDTESGGPGGPGGPGGSGGSGRSGGSGGSASTGSNSGDGAIPALTRRPENPTQPTYPTYSTYPTYPTYPAVARSSWLVALTRGLSQGEPVVRDFLLGNARSEGLGSNNWVIDGTLSASGKPLLANDPHLSARLPSTWYLAHVAGGDFEMIGATLPGAPAVALGRNRYIAWGATNVAADVEDLYVEKLNAAGTHAEFRGAQEPLTIIPETILVKGADPVRIDVRVTRHGPIVSDAINANNAALKTEPKPPPLEPLAFRWTALDGDDSTVPSFLKLNEARDWGQFTEALRDFVSPSQNFVYGDVNGHIGYYAPGRIPMRASGDGSLPADGWSGNAEWTGWVRFDELPHLYDPPEHFIITANHRPAPPSYPHLLGLEWPEPYRAQRIHDLLQRARDEAQRRGWGLTADDFARMQADTLSLHAKALLPLLLSHARPEGGPPQQAAALLQQWDGHSGAESAAAAIFGAWFHHLAPVLAGDDLGKLLVDRYSERFTFVTRFAARTLTANDASWCDDKTTPPPETCDDAATAALREAVADLTRRLGTDMSRWRWDGVHRAVFPHQGLDAVKALRPILSRSVPNGGDWSTVNVAPAAAEAPYDQKQVPGYREIIDLSSANDSRFLDAVGQSGHFLSPHYDDFLADWRAVKHKKMRMDRRDIEAGAIGRLRLTP
jgi:penicillin amidase